jgi:hypothetical protein
MYDVDRVQYQCHLIAPVHAYPGRVESELPRVNVNHPLDRGFPLSWPRDDHDPYGQYGCDDEDDGTVLHR